MRIVIWAIRLVVLVLLIAFAAKNVEPVTLRFYFGLALQAPLVLLLAASFAVGALFGVLALTGTLLRQRREIGSLRKHLAPEPLADERPSPPAL